MFFVAYFIAIIVGWAVGYRRDVNMLPAIFSMLVAAFVLSRSAYIAHHWQQYSGHVAGVIELADGGFYPVYAVAGSLLVAGYYAIRQPKLRMALLSGIVSAALVWGAALVLYDTIETNKQVPQLEYQTLAEQPITLAEFSGKPIVVNLWASWCPPCRREMPAFMQAQQQWSGVNFVFLNQGEFSYTVDNFLQKQQLKLTNVLLDPQQSTMHQMGFAGLPATLFYNSEGQLIYTHTGEISEKGLTQALLTIQPQHQ